MTDIEQQKAKLQGLITQSSISKVIAWALLDIAGSLRDQRLVPPGVGPVTSPFTSDKGPYVPRETLEVHAPVPGDGILPGCGCPHCEGLRERKRSL